jgi:hypothetical protein
MSAPGSIVIVRVAPALIVLLGGAASGAVLGPVPAEVGNTIADVGQSVLEETDA